MEVLAIIPSRYNSSRLPGKPLLNIQGKSLIERVFEQCQKCKEVSRTIVSTDDERIAFHVKSIGGEVIMTSSDHRTGTDRCGEVINKINDQYDIILCVDEVVCGFGRTGEWFGSQHFNIKPDIITFAIGITSGYLPLSGVGVGKKVSDVFINQGKDFYHGYTYSGHPVACAVAIENLRIIISQIRNFKATYQIKNNTVLKVYSNNEVDDWIKNQLEVLAKVEIQEEKLTDIAESTFLHFNSGDYDFSILAEEYIDIEVEVNKLNNKSKEIEKSVEISNKRLNNTKFMENAKTELIDEEKKKKEELELELKLIHKTLKELGN